MDRRTENPSSIFIINFPFFPFLSLRFFSTWWPTWYVSIAVVCHGSQIIWAFESNRNCPKAWILCSFTHLWRIFQWLLYFCGVQMDFTVNEKVPTIIIRLCLWSPLSRTVFSARTTKHCTVEYFFGGKSENIKFCQMRKNNIRINEFFHLKRGREIN